MQVHQHPKPYFFPHHHLISFITIFFINSRYSSILYSIFFIATSFKIHIIKLSFQKKHYRIFIFCLSLNGFFVFLIFQILSNTFLLQGTQVNEKKKKCYNPSSRFFLEVYSKFYFLLRFSLYQILIFFIYLLLL